MKSGLVALVGRPNVGKSTLLNALLGQKLAIVSDKPQTTRSAVRGVLHRPEGQIVLVDTPGLHKPRTLLGQRLNDLVRGTLAEVDLILQLVDAAAGVGAGDRFLAAELVAAARGARERSYAPYSGFRVGAALLTAQGDVVTAANVENASYGLAICAERSAVVAAVAAGSRSFVSIAVAGNGPDPVTPCGACRQVLREFPKGPDLEVLCAGEAGDALVTTTLGALLPDSFGPEDLRGSGP